MYFRLLVQLYDRKKPSFIIGDRIFITYTFRKKSLKINLVKTLKSWLSKFYHVLVFA